MRRKPGSDRSYLLRLWKTRRGEEGVWWASLEDPHTGQRRGFARLMDLFARGVALDEPAGARADREVLVLDASASVWNAMSRMEGFVGESIPVLEDGRLVGVLFESTIVSAYLRILEDIRREEHAAM